jgi:3-hydroxyisobutyrate dehydrogenase-like beta-hydroxyacid dehydrogenase
MALKVGFIGLGSMGLPFATNIAEAGFDLVVHDLQADAVGKLVSLGARAAATAREVAEYADIVDIAVPHEPHVDAVMRGPDGLLAGAHSGLIAVIHSSLHPTNMQKVAQETATHGVEVLDAQMSGGAQGVRTHTLCLMVGGSREAFEKCRPVLETTANNIHFMGPVGMGAATKVAQNTMTALNLLAASEGFRLAEKMGVDLSAFQTVVSDSAAQSHIADAYMGQWSQRSIRWGYYDVLKDALDLAHAHDITLPGAAACMQALAFSMRKD